MSREDVACSQIVGPGFEQYLEGIYHLEERSRAASTSALAETLDVRMASVTGMLKRLEAAGLIRYAPHQPAELTAAGRTIALHIVRRHRLWEEFLTDYLGIPIDDVYAEACDLEHATSGEVEARLNAYLGGPRLCPHGHPIPDAECHIDHITD